MIGKLIRMGVMTWLAGYVTRKVAARMGNSTPANKPGPAPRQTRTY